MIIIFDIYICIHIFQYTPQFKQKKEKEVEFVIKAENFHIYAPGMKATIFPLHFLIIFPTISIFLNALSRIFAHTIFPLLQCFCYNLKNWRKVC